MPQFYLLSVIFNFIAGLALFIENEEKNESTEGMSKPGIVILNWISNLFQKEWINLFLGAVCFIVGLFKFFLPYAEASGKSVIFFGDFLPMTAGLSLGVVLFFNFLKKSTEVTADLMTKAEKYLLTNKKYFGITGMAVSILHFLFPGALII